MVIKGIVIGIFKVSLHNHNYSHDSTNTEVTIWNTLPHKNVFLRLYQLICHAQT